MNIKLEYMDTKDLTETEKLLHDLIFNDEENEFEISLFEYIEDIKTLETFTNNILEKITRSGVEVMEQAFILTESKKKWTIKLYRTNNVEEKQ